MDSRPPLAPYLLLALALVGLGDTLYLSYFQYLNLIPSCAIQGCEIVLTSTWSKFLGVPWSYIGLVYYTYLLGLSILLIIDPHSKGLRVGALVYTTAGLAYSVWAIGYVQLSVLHALCQYCLVSAAVTLAAALVAFVSLRPVARS